MTLAPTEHLAMFKDIFVVTTRWRVGVRTGMLLASSEYKPGVLLNFLQRTGQSPTAKNYSGQNVSSVIEKILL